uniref:Uncharacterized protein n=1 Tax=Tetraselmis sp. GSL018 TaxID=582737 RepID=A0A061S492_9CHLO
MKPRDGKETTDGMGGEVKGRKGWLNPFRSLRLAHCSTLSIPLYRAHPDMLPFRGTAAESWGDRVRVSEGRRGLSAHQPLSEGAQCNVYEVCRLRVVSREGSGRFNLTAVCLCLSFWGGWLGEGEGLHPPRRSVPPSTWKQRGRSAPCRRFWRSLPHSLVRPRRRSSQEVGLHQLLNPVGLGDEEPAVLGPGVGAHHLVDALVADRLVLCLVHSPRSVERVEDALDKGADLRLYLPASLAIALARRGGGAAAQFLEGRHKGAAAGRLRGFGLGRRPRPLSLSPEGAGEGASSGSLRSDA